MLNWLRGKRATSPPPVATTPPANPTAQSTTDVDPLIPVPIPALVSILLHVERTNGAPLTEAEVNAVRDSCTCITMHRSHARALAHKRGYDDIDPEHAWPQWLAIRGSLYETGEEPVEPYRSASEDSY